jgi:hypothetical protein
MHDESFSLVVPRRLGQGFVLHSKLPGAVQHVAMSEGAFSKAQLNILGAKSG